MDSLNVSFEGLTLHVEDVERSRDFYLRIPGVVLEDHRPGQFALLRIGETLLGLLRLGRPGFHLELTTADLDGLHAHLLQVGLEPEGPPQAQKWGERTFLVLDPDGNAIEFQ